MTFTYHVLYILWILTWYQSDIVRLLPLWQSRPLLPMPLWQNHHLLPMLFKPLCIALTLWHSHLLSTLFMLLCIATFSSPPSNTRLVIMPSSTFHLLHHQLLQQLPPSPVTSTTPTSSCSWRSRRSFAPSLISFWHSLCRYHNSMEVL